MKKKWFKRKLYGYGWVPSSWEGWTILILFLALNTIRLMGTLEASSEKEMLKHFLPFFVITTAVLIFICIRFGEKPRWQWGEELKD